MAYGTLKSLMLISLFMVTGSFKANADLPLPMVGGMTETQEFLLTGDTFLLVGFSLWIAYIVFGFPKANLRKL